jgi:hypothetical protein
MLIWLDLQQCLSKGSKTRGTAVESGDILFEFYTEAGMVPPVDPGAIEIASDLALAQERLGQPIFIPAGPLTDEEDRTISKLRRLVRRPVELGTWKGFEGVWQADEAERELQPFLDGQSGPIQRERIERAELAGRAFSLGRVLYKFESAKLADTGEVRTQLASVIEPSTNVWAHFKPAESDKVTILYHDWVTDSIDQVKAPDSE